MEQHQQFEGLASLYDKYRPSYPEDILLTIKEYDTEGQNGDEAMKAILDVGAGTGILTRLLRRYFNTDTAIIGVEPGNDMRQTAIGAQPLQNVAYIRGTAERLPFEGKTVNGITVAQAVHWFDRPGFYKEAVRVLRAGGFLAILQNNRMWQGHPFMDDFESLLEEYNKNYSRYYRSFDVLEEIKEENGLTDHKKVESSWHMQMSAAAFINRSLSSTKVQGAANAVGVARMKELIQELVIEHYGDADMFDIPYTTELVLARKK